MDSSTSTAQDVQTQQPSDDNAVSPTQPVAQPQSVQQPKPQPKAPTMISVGGEAGAGMMVQENPDAEDEDEIVAPQETKNLGAMGQGEEESDEQQLSAQPGAVEIQEGTVEIQPSIPEVPTSSPEVEKVIERIENQESPKLSQQVKDAGVTHSGPGVIDVTQISFEKVKLPVNYTSAVTQVKETKLHDSKHWFMGVMTYVWRKVRPGIEKQVAEEAKKKQPVLATPPVLKAEKVPEIQAK